MEDQALFEQYRATGDISIRNKIVEKYLYIASVIAKKFVGRGVEYDDLFQVASLALIKGVDRFDVSKGLQFSTFITPTITGEIKNYFRDRSRLVHLPRRVAELRVSVKRAAEELTAETGKKPTAKELAARLSVLSLDRSASGEEEGMSYYDVLPAEDMDIEALEQRDAVSSALKILSKEERALVRYRFSEELSQTETAKRLGVSQMYVSRMERRVLNKLRENYKNSMAD